MDEFKPRNKGIDFFKILLALEEYVSHKAFLTRWRYPFWCDIHSPPPQVYDDITHPSGFIFPLIEGGDIAIPLFESL